jgi:hypothetical protein
VLLSFLYAAFQRDVDELQRYVIAYIPLLIWLYLSRSRVVNDLSGQREILCVRVFSFRCCIEIIIVIFCVGVCAVLLLLYNDVVAERDGKPRRFNPPLSSIESIYSKRTLSLIVYRKHF